MNVFIADGWLRDAVFRRAPSGAEAVELDVMVKGRDRVTDHLVKMWLKDAATIESCRLFLTRGRAVLVHASVETEPIKDRFGATAGEHLVFLVEELKIPNRTKPAEVPAPNSELRASSSDSAAA